MWQIQVECDEWTMLHAQSTQGGAIDLQRVHMDQNKCMRAHTALTVTGHIFIRYFLLLKI